VTLADFKGRKVFIYFYPKASTPIIRSAFLVDEKGRIAGAWYKVSPDDTVPQAMQALVGTSPGG